MKTIIAGSRDGILYMDVVEAMENCGWTPTEVVSGAARGVDSLGELWANRNYIKIKQFIMLMFQIQERDGQKRLRKWKLWPFKKYIKMLS